MKEQIYIDNINELLKTCWKTTNKTTNTTNITKQQTTSSTEKNEKTPFILKSFQTMYNQFLYKKNLRKKTADKKPETIKLITTFDEL